MISNDNDDNSKTIKINTNYKKCKINKTPKIRKNIKDYENKTTTKLILEDYDNNLHILNQLYFNEEFDHSKLYKKCINNKLSSYLHQDRIKYRNIEHNINYNQVIEKLIICKLKCYYCKNKILLLHRNKRQKTMWTLDRIDNNLSHTDDNTCISCLSCNLQKKTRNHDNFKFTKQLIIKKTYFDD